MLVPDDYSYAPYRSRYSAEESSNAVYEKDQRHRLWLGRKRRVKRLLLSVACIVVVGVVTRVYEFVRGIRVGSHSLIGHWEIKTKPAQGYDNAITDSYGFFNMIADDDWDKMKQETMTLNGMQDATSRTTSDLLSEGGANINSKLWWDDNWKINFTCKNKFRIGGYWLCDPMRIMAFAAERAEHSQPRERRKKRKGKTAEQKECIVYVSGGRDVEFANHLLDYLIARKFEQQNDQEKDDLLGCEVHMFAPSMQELVEPRDGLFLHKWGFRPSNKESMGIAADSITAVAFKTIKDTVAELQHSGRISVLALDCESCEWDIYSDILALDEPIQQVLMQMHGTPFVANELFLAMQQTGYVIFHREPNSDGEIYDYSWLKLAPSFSSGST